jgi:hypothetical protein
MPDPTFMQLTTLVQVFLLLLVPAEILLASASWIRAEYETRDTLAMCYCGRTAGVPSRNSSNSAANALLSSSHGM